MKIVIITGAGDYTGGCRMAHAYGKALREAGHGVCFLTGDRPDDGGPCLADVLAQENFEVHQETGFFRLRDTGLIMRAAELFQRTNADLVVSTIQVDLKIVGPAARRAQIPYVVFDQTTHRFHGPLLLRMLKRNAFAREMRGAAGVIAVGGAVGEQAVKEFRCKPERVTVIPNGIDTVAFGQSPRSAGDLPPKQNGNLRLLNVGRLDLQKGQIYLIEAVGQCRQAGIACELSLVGEATANHAESERYAHSLRQRTKDLALEGAVHFLGFRQDIKALHQAADVYVHSAMWEGPPLPLAIMEAMASGRPTILTDCAGWPEGFEQGVHGKVVKAGNATALAEAITWMSGLSPEARHAMGDKARELIALQYDVSTLSKRFVAACERILELSGPPVIGAS